MKLVSIKKRLTMIVELLAYVLLESFNRFVLWLLMVEEEE